MRKKGTRLAFYLFLALVGALAGTVLGDAAATYVPILARSYTLGVPAVDLVVIGFGLWLKLNLGGVLGMLIMLFLFRRH